MRMTLAEAITTYFRGEKTESLLILLAVAVLLVAAVVLFAWFREPFTRGLAAMFVFAALVGGSVGVTVYLRTDAQVAGLLDQARDDPAAFREAEGPRMATVVSSFGWYRLGYAAAALLALGFVFLVGRPLYHGLAVGLLVFAALGLTIDYYAETRAVRYVADAGLGR
jgi:hypothetical protein